MLDKNQSIQAGARNLLLGCAGLSAGSQLLILREPSCLGFYGDELANAVSTTARAMQIDVTISEVPFATDIDKPAPSILRQMRAADCTLFLARMGDQIRFKDALSDVNAVVCYALDGDMLGSPFGTLEHKAFLELKRVLNDAIRSAEAIRVTCPLGTDFSGTGGAIDQAGDVNVARFPMSVFTPCPSTHFSGRIAQRGYLVGTGSRYYDPYAVPLVDTLIVEFEGHSIREFTGAPQDVATAKSHYSNVARRYGIDGAYLHSWHAGIHPGCAYMPPASHNFERWSGGAFGNPRLLHFHTCGAYAPGEISLNVLDPTIRLDGIAVWEDGRLFPERVPGGREILNSFPDVRSAFESPAQDCGLGAEGALSYS